MKVNGQLEKAQFENIANAAPTPAPTGRVYIDTSGTIGVPRIYTGGAWQPFRLGQSTALYDNGTTTGSSITIDWSNGLNQKMKLGSHCLIKFQNPVAGEVHRLVVLQNNAETSGVRYRYQLDLADQAARRSAYQPVGVLHSSALAEHSWFYSAATIPAYATVPNLAPGNPATLLTTSPFGIAFSPDGKLVAQGNNTTPFIHFAQFQDDGDRTHLNGMDPVAPTAAAGQVNQIVFHPNGRLIFWATSVSPFIQGRWLTADGAPNGPAFANPATLPAAARTCIDMHPSGAYVVVGGGTSPFMECYPISASAFGTKVADPGTLPTGAMSALAWSPFGDYLATSPVGADNNLAVYSWTGTAFGSKLTPPATLPVGAPSGPGKAIAWRPQGDWLVVASSAGAFLYVYPFDRTIGTIGTAAVLSGTLPAAAPTGIAWSPDGQFLAVGFGSSPFMYIYPYSASTGITLTPIVYDTSAGPGSQVSDVAWHPSGDLLIGSLQLTPFMYNQAVPRTAKNYIRITD